MAYREVTMVEVKEVLRLWLAGRKKKRIAAQLGLDAKTVRRYIAGAARCGLLPKGPVELTDEKLAEVLLALRSSVDRVHGDGWQRCLDERADIETLLGRGLRLSKVRPSTSSTGVDIPYSTLHRFAVAELGFGRAAPKMPVADGKPGEEVQVDTGWMTLLESDARPTPKLSRVDLHPDGVGLSLRSDELRCTTTTAPLLPLPLASPPATRRR